jgi:hypothetical protein
MFGIKRQLFISYFCKEESGCTYFGNTSAFSASKVTPEFIDYIEIKLKNELEVKELVILYWRYY